LISSRPLHLGRGYGLARSRLYVVRDSTATVVARQRPWLPGCRTVRRRLYATLVEKAPPGDPQR